MRHKQCGKKKEKHIRNNEKKRNVKREEVVCKNRLQKDQGAFEMCALLTACDNGQQPIKIHIWHTHSNETTYTNSIPAAIGHHTDMAYTVRTQHAHTRTNTDTYTE